MCGKAYLVIFLEVGCVNKPLAEVGKEKLREDQTVLTCERVEILLRFMFFDTIF